LLEAVNLDGMNCFIWGAMHVHVDLDMQSKHPTQYYHECSWTHREAFESLKWSENTLATWTGSK